MLSPFEHFVWHHSQEKLHYKRYKPTTLFFMIIWSWLEKWSCGRRGTRAWNLAFPPQATSLYNQTVSRLPALIDGETVCFWDESNPIRVTCPSQAGMCVSERPSCQIQESLISLHCAHFTFVTLSHESRASGPILWSHYLILRLVEWCWVLKPEGVMWERFRLHKHALLLLWERPNRQGVPQPTSPVKAFQISFTVLSCLSPFSFPLVFLQLFPSSPVKWNSQRADSFSIIPAGEEELS